MSAATTNSPTMSRWAAEKSTPGTSTKAGAAIGVDCSTSWPFAAITMSPHRTAAHGTEAA
jgi:hypothetical protein